MKKSAGTTVIDAAAILEGFDYNEALEQQENAKLNAKTGVKMTSTPVPTAGTTKASKAPAEPKPAPQPIDIAPLMAKLPTEGNITPATLDKLFQLNDGGKTIRRGLRKHFAATMGHEHKATWVWATNDPILAEIIQYFGQRYAVAK